MDQQSKLYHFLLGFIGAMFMIFMKKIFDQFQNHLQKERQQYSMINDSNENNNKIINKLEEISTNLQQCKKMSLRREISNIFREFFNIFTGDNYSDEIFDTMFWHIVPIFFKNFSSQYLKTVWENIDNDIQIKIINSLISFLHHKHGFENIEERDTKYIFNILEHFEADDAVKLFKEQIELFNNFSSDQKKDFVQNNNYEQIATFVGTIIDDTHEQYLRNIFQNMRRQNENVNVPNFVVQNLNENRNENRNVDNNLNGQNVDLLNLRRIMR
jgi:hypothetical protein